MISNISFCPPYRKCIWTCVAQRVVRRYSFLQCTFSSIAPCVALLTFFFHHCVQLYIHSLFHCPICYHLLLYYPSSHSILFLSQKMTVRLCNPWARVAIMCICGIVPVRYEAPYWKGLNINSRVRSAELLTNDRFLPTPPYARPYTTLLSRLVAQARSS